MTKLAFRNSKGNLKNEYDEFKARSNTLDELCADADSLLVRMQTPKARRGMNNAFHASPAQLRRAAVKATRKRR